VSKTTICYHEAGHVIVALAVGRRLVGVSVDPVAGSAGLCELEPAFTGEPTSAQLEAVIAFTAAGRIAEQFA
jgi:ATP-dependent Zn protease